MKPYNMLLVAAFFAILPGCSTMQPDGQGGWQSIFNGRDLSGWMVKCAPADRNHTFWRVDKGAILADSMDSTKHDYVWLTTEKEYADFTLRLKFQAFRDSPGNSGAQIRSRYDDITYWLDGPQIDINPLGPWRTGMIWDETRGSSRWLSPAVPKGQWVEKSMARKDLRFLYAEDKDAWNDLEIEAVGMRIRVTLNGLLVTDYDGAGVLDDALHRERNVGTRGHIGLQIHRDDQLRIRFKDIRIREG